MNNNTRGVRLCAVWYCMLIYRCVTLLLPLLHCTTTPPGTPYYLAPELCREEPYNNKSDIWSLGVLLYEMMCFKMPFDGRGIGELMKKILRGRPASIPAARYVKDSLYIQCRN